MYVWLRRTPIRHYEHRRRHARSWFSWVTWVYHVSSIMSLIFYFSPWVGLAAPKPFSVLMGTYYFISSTHNESTVILLLLIKFFTTSYDTYIGKPNGLHSQCYLAPSVPLICNFDWPHHYYSWFNTCTMSSLTIRLTRFIHYLPPYTLRDHSRISQQVLLDCHH